MAAFSNNAFDTNAFSIFAFSFPAVAGAAQDQPIFFTSVCIHGEKFASVNIGEQKIKGVSIVGENKNSVRFNGN